MPISIALESDVAGAEVDKIGAGAAHDRLVIIVAERIVIRDEFENGAAPRLILWNSRAHTHASLLRTTSLSLESGNAAAIVQLPNL
jgi:hypothetical protein